MNTLPLSLHPDMNVSSQKEDQSTLRWIQICGAITGLGGGVVAALSGSLLTAASWFARDAAVKHGLSTIGTIFLCATIPLIVLGAFCLDWLEKDKSQRWSKESHGEDEGDEG